MKGWIIAFGLSLWAILLVENALTTILLTISTLGLFWSWVNKELEK